MRLCSPHPSHSIFEWADLHPSRIHRPVCTIAKRVIPYGCYWGLLAPIQLGHRLRLQSTHPSHSLRFSISGMVGGTEIWSFASAIPFWSQGRALSQNGIRRTIIKFIQYIVLHVCACATLRATLHVRSYALMMFMMYAQWCIWWWDSKQLQNS